MKTRVKFRLLLLTSLTLLPALSGGANLTWDANTSQTGAQDGSGTWDTAANNWWTGSANAVFNNATPDAAFLGATNGAAGTVTLGSPIISGNIFFNPASVGNYVVAGSGANTLATTNRFILLNVNATISANLVGTALTLSHGAQNTPSGILTLSGDNSGLSGTFRIGEDANNPNGIAPLNTTCAVRPLSGTAFGTGTIVYSAQGSQTSPRMELVAGLTITNPVTWAGRNNPSAAVVVLSSGNIFSGRWTRGGGGLDGHIASEVANGLTLSGATAGGIAIDSVAPSARFAILRGTGGGTISGIISNGTVNTGLVKAGSGTWTLSGGPNPYSNGTIVDDGTLLLDYSINNNTKWSAAGNLTLGGGKITLSGGSFSQTNASTIIGAGASSIARNSGSSTLRMNAITRNRGGVLDFNAASIADCDNNDVNGILGGGYATIAGADWAHTASSGAADTAITAYTGYNDIDVLGSTIADNATSNVRFNSASGAGNVALAAATTTIQTLLQNTTVAATIDTTGKTLRLGTNGAILIPDGKEGVTVGASVNSGTLTAGAADNTAGELIFINNSTSASTINSTVANNGTGVLSLTKAGSGTLTLAGNNTHTGTNIIAAGTLNISSDANLGASPGVATASKILINGGVLNATEDMTLDSNRGISLGPTSRYGNGTISVASGKTLNYGGIIANSDTSGNGPGGSLTKTGNGTLALSGVNSYTFGTIINAGTLIIVADNNLGGSPGCYFPDSLVINGGTLGIQGTFTLNPNRGIRLGPIGSPGSGTISIGDSQTATFNGQISDSWAGTGSFIKSGNGTLVLGGMFNDYSGNTTVSVGTLQINNARSIPNGAGKGNVTVNGTLNINGMSVGINGLSGNGTVDNITSTAITLGIGNNNQSSSFSGTVQNSGGGAIALSKVGNGTFTLTGAENHTGSTLVTAGTLALTGSATISSTTNIAVSSSATLDVSGMIGGTLTLNSGQILSGTGATLGTVNTGSGVLAPGGILGGAGTLTAASLTLGSGSSLNYDIANVTTTGMGVNDYTIVTGHLTVAGPVTLNVNYLNAVPASSGKYTLFSYNSFFGNVTDISVPSGFTINNNTSAKTIELLINHTPVSLLWRGDGASDIWDINSTPNWNANTTTFFNGDTANFDDTGSNNPPIFISTPVIAGAVAVNASQTYNFTGSSISSGLLTKSGSGTLILENDNNFASGGSINGGTVQVGNGGATGSLTGGALTNNGAIIVNRSGDIFFTNNISGSGSINQNNLNGATALSGSNSYSGLTLVSAGRVYARNGSAFGDVSSGTTVSADAQIYIDANVNVGPEPLTLNGNGLNGDGGGALRKGGMGVTIFGGPVTLGSDTTINLDGGATLNFTNAAGITSAGPVNLTLIADTGSSGSVSGPLNLGGGGGVLTKSGSGSWTLAGSNAMSLATIANGTLILANTNALGTNLNVVLSTISGGVGLTGTRLTLSGGLSFDATRTLSLPSSGSSGYRSAFFGTGTGVTNSWAGTITLFGDTSTASMIAFGAENGSTLLISGTVTADASFLGKLLLRGNGAGNSTTGLGILLGSAILDPVNGQVQFDDGATWILGSSGNIWATTFFANASRVILGAHNALPTSTAFSIANGATGRIDLNGFNQNLPGLAVGGLAITNRSTSADSTLTLSSTISSSFGGSISDGSRQLNLNISAGTLILTNVTALNLTNSSVSIASGAALELDYVNPATNTVNALVLNGATQPAGVYSAANASPYITSTTGNGYVLVQSGPSGPATLTNTVSGNTLTLTWPAGLGWRLQAQTNSLATGLTTDWTYLTDGNASSVNITIYPTNPSVFFRLRYP